MSLFAIGDLHLAIGEPDKTMEAFGGRWIGYVDKIRRGFDLMHEDDTCVICGDFCWAMSLAEALPDFQFLNSLPGKTLFLRKTVWTPSLCCIITLRNGKIWRCAARAAGLKTKRPARSMTPKSSGARSDGWKRRSNAPASGKSSSFSIIRRCIFIIPVRRYCMCSPNTACMSAVTAISTATAAAARSSARAMASGTALFPQIFLILFRISSDNPLQFAF